MQPTCRRKLIEVDLPLDVINYYSKREKPVNHGHPSSLHQWWARLTLAAARAVIFSSLVDDPSSFPDEFPSEEAQNIERKRLHSIIERIVVWKNSNDVRLLDEARYEIARSISRSARETLAPIESMTSKDILSYLSRNSDVIHDPFAGGGYIPLEAQRLGLRAVASDLNPLAVLINKSLIEIPPEFAGMAPVHSSSDPFGMLTGKYIGRGKNKKPEQLPWRGSAGLAADIRHYGQWIKDEAFFFLTCRAFLPSGKIA